MEELAFWRRPARACDRGYVKHQNPLLIKISPNRESRRTSSELMPETLD